MRGELVAHHAWVFSPSRRDIDGMLLDLHLFSEDEERLAEFFLVIESCEVDSHFDDFLASSSAYVEVLLEVALGSITIFREKMSQLEDQPHADLSTKLQVVFVGHLTEDCLDLLRALSKTGGYASCEDGRVGLRLAEHFQEEGVLGVDYQVADELGKASQYSDAEVPHGEETGRVEKDFLDAEVDFLRFFPE